MTSLVDRYLLYRIRALRDPEAFARLYDKYVSQIYRFVLLKLPSKEDAEDLTSETFLKSWRYLQENREVTEFRGLLYRIARNAIVDWYRELVRNVRSRAAASRREVRSGCVDSALSPERYHPQIRA